MKTYKAGELREDMLVVPVHALESATPSEDGREVPKVVAYRYTSGMRLSGKWHYQESFPKWDDRRVREIGQMDELMTVAQHSRIVAAKDAEIAELTSELLSMAKLNDENVRKKESALSALFEARKDGGKSNQEAPTYQFQAREIGESDWAPCDYSWYLYCQKSPEHDTLVIEVAQPALQVGVENKPALPDGWLIELGFDVLDRSFRLIENRSHVPTIKIIMPACEVDDLSAWNLRDEFASRISAALAPSAACVMPERDSRDHGISSYGDGLNGALD